VSRTIVAGDGTRHFDHMSRGIERLVGVPPQEILAHAELLYARIHPEDRRALVAAQEYSLGTGSPIELELRVTHVDGTQRWLDLHSAAERRAHGVIAWEGVVVDVTERKRAHAVQREAEERLRLMVEGVKDYALFGLDLEGNVNSWNAGAQRLLGYSAVEILGRNFSCLHIADEIESGEVRRELVAAAAQGRYEVEGWRVRKGGTRFLADAVVAALRDSNGVLRGFVKVLRDVSARKRAQREREDLLDQLRALNSELEARVAERTEELEATLREREVLLKEIHHRVKNNLQVVSSLISMQLRHVPDGEAAKTLEECKARVHTMALIHEQLYRSRDFASISFSQYFNDVARNVFQATGVSSKSISLELAIQEVSLGMEKAIPCGLILNELMSNALKHGFPHGRQGRVRVTLESLDGDNLRMAVSDDGVGLPPGLEVDKCSSLGLQLVSVLTGQLHGKLQIHEAAGGGTTFELVFPLDAGKPRTSTQPRQVQAASATSATV